LGAVGTSKPDKSDSFLAGSGVLLGKTTGETLKDLFELAGSLYG